LEKFAQHPNPIPKSPDFFVNTISRRLRQRVVADIFYKSHP
jgi:hypothetical protein